MIHYDLVLTENQARSLANFIPPPMRHLGGEHEIHRGQVHLRLGSRPILRSLAASYRAAGKEPFDIHELYDTGDLWILTVSAGILSVSGWDEVQQLDVELQFDEDPPVTILAVLPDSHFIHRAKVGFEFSTTLSAAGTIKPSIEIPAQLLPQLPAAAEAALQASISTGADIHISSSVISPIVQAIGVGSADARWVIRKDEKPLLGDQPLTVIFRTPRNPWRVKFKVRLGCVITSFGWFPNALQAAEWMPFELKPDDAITIFPECGAAHD